MPDKSRVREAQAGYAAWSRAEGEARAREALAMTPARGMETCLEISALCLELRGRETPPEARPDLETYYERIRRFEAWRSALGR